MYEEKQICSMNWSKMVKKRLKRLASILEISESELSEKGIIYFIEHSDICKQALKKIREHDQIIGCFKKKRHTIIEKSDGTSVYQFRPEITPEEEEEEK